MWCLAGDGLAERVAETGIVSQKQLELFNATMMPLLYRGPKILTHAFPVMIDHTSIVRFYAIGEDTLVPLQVDFRAIKSHLREIQRNNPI
ncbi:hypothetical protein Moror_15312 [Moniliophthora roreri MCA 2997]|uniref:Uncharacterized protein n=1 Tax=Moniliophthora roreri (strain MCA 2997) TaxID=1381753 RepID=V2Y815_MONRO|nr:hypothetical protein Moror_15312 [Moniliophthora roreri MCA 2997]